MISKWIYKLISFIVTLNNYKIWKMTENWKYDDTNR
jgi:hypothetical protein